MDGPQGRKIFADAGRALYTLAVAEDAVYQPRADGVSNDKSSYTAEPSMFDRFVCFLAGMSYSGGSEIDANGKCQVKGELMPRNYRGR